MTSSELFLPSRRIKKQNKIPETFDQILICTSFNPHIFLLGMLNDIKLILNEKKQPLHFWIFFGFAGHSGAFTVVFPADRRATIRPCSLWSLLVGGLLPLSFRAQVRSSLFMVSILGIFCQFGFFLYDSKPSLKIGSVNKTFLF